MKKYFIILFLSLSMGLSAQVRLGSSVSEIRSEFSDPKYELNDGYSNGDYYLQHMVERAVVIHVFDKDSIAFAAIIAPNNQGALNYYAEMYNEQYVIISDKKWKMYSDGGIADISLMRDKDNVSYFRWVDLDYINKLQISENNEPQDNDDDIVKYSYINPYVEAQNTSKWGNANIIAVDITKDRTLVIFEYTSAPYVEGGWISLSSSTKIIANNKTYESEIIKWSLHNSESESSSYLEFDEKYNVKPNRTYTFNMIFPLLPDDISVIDIIEDIDSKTAFNWKGIYLVKEK